jgi:hypothetical protein
MAQINQKNKQKRPLGEPFDLTSDELEAMSQITPADVKAAVALWNENAPKEFKGLLSSEPDEDDSNNSPAE